MRNVATEYLNTLRRAIEKADGLDEIFNKHMKNRTGKYIVFCSCFEAMTKKEERWEANYELLKAFYDEHGHCNISVSMKSGTGGSLYGWIANQKQLYKAGKMLPDRIEKFRAVGII